MCAMHGPMIRPAIIVDGMPSVVVNVSSTVSEDILHIADATNEYMEEFNGRNTTVKATLINDATIVLAQRISMLLENGAARFRPRDHRPYALPQLASCVLGSTQHSGRVRGHVHTRTGLHHHQRACRSSG